MNTAQCKAFICDPTTVTNFPDFDEIMGATYIPGVSLTKNWKRVVKNKQTINVVTTDGYPMEATTEYPIYIVDPSLPLNTNIPTIFRQFAHANYECLYVGVYTNAEDDHIVAFDWNID